MMTKERKKVATLVGLLVILAAALIYNYRSGSVDSGSITRNKVAVSPGASMTKAAPAAAGKRLGEKAGGDESSEQGFRPLPLYALSDRSSVPDEPKRNIFVYYSPPPAEIPLRKGPPPTISLTALSPDQVYARTGEFVLRVKGLKFPEDVKILINGQEQETQFVNPSELSTTVGKALIAAPGTLRVEVRNARGDFSNELALSVMEPPAPSYKYVGRIGDMVFLASGEDRYPVRIGNVVDEKKAPRWRVVAASDGNVTIEDVLIGVNHRLEMDLTQAAATTPGQLGPAERSRVRPRLPQQWDESEDQEAFQQEQEEMQNQQLLQQQMLQQRMLQQRMLQQQLLEQRRLQQQGQPQIGQPRVNLQQIRPRPFNNEPNP